MAFKKKVTELLENNDPSELIIDLSDATTIDSSGISTLVFLFKSIDSKLKIINIPKDIYELLTKMRLDKHINLEMK